MSVRDQENHPDISAGEDTPGPGLLKKLNLSFFLTFIIMFAIWILLSGKFDLFHISLGVVSCFIVSFISGDLLFSSPKLKEITTISLRFIMYIPWLLYQIFIANLHVLYLVFHPRMMELIDPQIIEFRSRLTSDVSKFTFANSITLTPGTITVFVSVFSDFQVHAISKRFAQGLPGEMEERILKVFGE